MQPRIVALVPMRHGSERVLGKNYRPFAGRPLYHRIIETLLGCSRISEVVIDTDSPVIRDDARDVFPRVRLIDRPEALRGGTVPMNKVLLHDVGLIAADFYLQTHSTNPLLQAATIEKAIDAFLEEQPEHDSLFGVTRMQTRLWWPDGRAVNHDPAVLLRTQDLPPVLEENSNLYIFSRESLEQRGNRIGDRPLLFEIARTEAWDIDDETDFAIAEWLYRSQRDEV